MNLQCIATTSDAKFCMLNTMLQTLSCVTISTSFNVNWFDPFTKMEIIHFNIAVWTERKTTWYMTGSYYCLSVCLLYMLIPHIVLVFPPPKVLFVFEWVCLHLIRLNMHPMFVHVWCNFWTSSKSHHYGVYYICIYIIA